MSFFVLKFKPRSRATNLPLLSNTQPSMLFHMPFAGRNSMEFHISSFSPAILICAFARESALNDMKCTLKYLDSYLPGISKSKSSPHPALGNSCGRGNLGISGVLFGRETKLHCFVMHVNVHIPSTLPYTYTPPPGGGGPQTLITPHDQSMLHQSNLLHA